MQTISVQGGGKPVEAIAPRKAITESILGLLFVHQTIQHGLFVAARRDEMGMPWMEFLLLTELSAFGTFRLRTWGEIHFLP